MNLIKKPIVIVGSGFAGINTALSLKKINPSVPILVIDSHSRFIFKPLLYEVLSDEIKSWEVAPKLETIFENSRITFLQNKLTSVHLSRNSLKFEDDLEIEYQYLVLCTGSIPNTFSIDGVDRYCNFFNNINDQQKLKILLDYSVNNSINKNLVIIGAGPSGVELACKINDIYNNYFKISLIEQAQEILPMNKLFNREEAEKAIFKRKINIFLNTSVKEVTKEKVRVSDELNQEKYLESDVSIWTAGVKPTLPFFDSEVEKCKQRLAVNSYLQLKSHANVFALGDIACIEGSEDLPVTAQVAMQQGLHTAKNLNALISNTQLSTFQFIDNGEMISLGIGEASISGMGLTLAGKLAFDIRRLIYASKLPLLRKSLQSTASWLLDKKSLFSQMLIKND
tara:strand:- start:1582 stop:2769 length:1188 start_codon:yes stop_codon:yes gene_type:complete